MSRSIIIISILMLHLLLAQSVAQNEATISGRVLDALTKEPLIGVNVEVIEGEQGAATNSDGRFVIEKVLPGIKRLRFSYIGYETVVKTDLMVMQARPAILEVEMQPQALEGEAVSVTAGYFLNDVTTQPSLVSLNKEEIRRYPGGFEDVVRTVGTLPGITVNTSGGRNDLLVRGGGPSENLYIVNNVEVPNINHFGTQGTSSGSLSFINLDFVDDISFTTGGFGAQYGDKMSSVLSLNLGQGRSDRYGGKMLISATQYGLDAEGPFTSVGNFIFSARRSYLDLIFKAAGLPFVPVYTDFNLLMNFQPSPRDRLFILGLGAIDQVDRDISSQENRVFNAGLMDNTQNQWITGFDYRRSLSKGYLDLTLNINNFRYNFAQADEHLTEYFRSQATEREIGIKLQNFWAFNQNFYLLSGATSKLLRNVNQTSFADSIYDRNGVKLAQTDLGLPDILEESGYAFKQALFSQLEWQGITGLEINFGIRADYFSFLNKSWYVAPRLAIKYKLTTEVAFKGSSGLYYQSPSLVWITKNENRNLRALNNLMTVVGMEYYLRPDTRISLEAYFKRYRDLPTGTFPNVTDYIVITNTGSSYGGREDDFQSFGYFDLISAGRGKTYGAEFFLQKKSADVPLYGQLSLTLGKSEYDAFNGRRYPGPFDQRFIFNLSGGYIGGTKWQFGARFRYFSGVPFTPVYRPSQNPIGNGLTQNLPEEYLSDRLPAGHHLDLRVDRFFNFKKWSLVVYLDVQNVYNYKIPVRPTYDFWEDVINTSNSIGILPSIGISANF